jgi:hypothetical protein
VIRRTVLIGLLVLLLAAGAAGARGGPPPPPFPHLAGAWSHAEINVKIRKDPDPHTLILDRGRVRRATLTQVTLVETNGVVVVIPVSPQAIITVDGLSTGMWAIERKMVAQTMRIDGGAAVRVRATS